MVSRSTDKIGSGDSEVVASHSRSTLTCFGTKQVMVSLWLDNSNDSGGGVVATYKGSDQEASDRPNADLGGMVMNATRVSVSDCYTQVLLGLIVDL